MIDDDRLRHMLGVARKCYSLALKDGKTEEVARTYFVMGLLHDIGFEFTDDVSDVSKVSYDVLQYLSMKNSGLFRWSLVQKAIKEQGQPFSKMYHTDNDKLRILNEAEMLIDSKGNEVNTEEKLEDIKELYGEDSRAYIDAIIMCEMIEEKKSE